MQCAFHQPDMSDFILDTVIPRCMTIFIILMSIFIDKYFVNVCYCLEVFTKEYLKMCAWYIVNVLTFMLHSYLESCLLQVKQKVYSMLSDN